MNSPSEMVHHSTKPNELGLAMNERLEANGLVKEPLEKVAGSSTIESKHMNERKNDRDISDEQINDALEHPLFKSDVVYDELGRPSVKYIGKDVTICINPETNVQITTWKTGTRVRRKYEKEGD